jgi:superfamily II DNA helicase RecQ
VFHDKTLADIVARRPRTLDEMAEVPGVGRSRVERYGAAILRLLGDGGGETPGGPPAATAETSPAPPGEAPTVPAGPLDAATGARARAAAREALAEGLPPFEALRAWRRAVASAFAQPPYVVFPDRTLAALAEALPADLPALEEVPGMGPAKLDRYGAALLQVFRDCEALASGGVVI